MKRLFYLMTFVALFSVIVNAQCDGRYQTPIFQSASVEEDVLYAVHLNESGMNQQLEMDIYTGEGDTATNRPVLIFCHGGSFYGGTKKDGDIVAFCTELAKMGYVAVSIEYRLTTFLNVLNNEKMIKAVMRAVQDGRAAVRFFRKDAATDNTYKIDPDNIYIGGSSAGAVLGLQTAYMDDVNELSPTWQGYVNDLGGMEAGDNQGYSSEVQGVFAYAGGLADTNWIHAGDVPFLTMHSKNDNTVLYNVGPPLNQPTLPDLYGSHPLNIRAMHVGVENVFYSYNGSAHPPHAAGAEVVDSTISYTAKFIHDLLPCSKTTSIAPPDYSNNLKVFPNPFSDQFQLDISSVAGIEQVEIFDYLGKKIWSEEISQESGIITVELPSLSPGVYVVKAKDRDNRYFIKKMQKY